LLEFISAVFQFPWDNIGVRKEHGYTCRLFQTTHTHTHKTHTYYKPIPVGMGFYHRCEGVDSLNSPPGCKYSLNCLEKVKKIQLFLRQLRKRRKGTSDEEWGDGNKSAGVK